MSLLGYSGIKQPSPVIQSSYLNPNESSVSEKGKAMLSACIRDSKLRLFKSKYQDKDAKLRDCLEIL